MLFLQAEAGFSLFMSPQQVVIFTLAIASLVLGIVLFLFVANNKKKRDSFNATIVICWLLIALFPVFLIFSLFPASSVDGTIFGFQLGGAFAAFILTWYFGLKNAKPRVEIDDLNKENAELKEELATVKQELAIKKVFDDIGEKLALQVKARPLLKNRRFEYQLVSNPEKKLGILTGNIVDIEGIDIWVNSENTNMQLARFYDPSISGIIRYYGAERHRISRSVVRDSIAEEVKEVMGDLLAVEPAAVIVTKSGLLLERNGVKRLFHVAAAQGQLGRGYKPVDNLAGCVTNSLMEADLVELGEGEQLQTILFPLMGTGTSGGDKLSITEQLVHAAVNFLERKSNTRIQTVYFLAYSDMDLDMLRKVYHESERLQTSAEEMLAMGQICEEDA